MVAFATDYEPETATVEPKNRVGNFFVDVPDCIGTTGPQTRTVAGENDRFSYDACRGVSLAQGGKWTPNKEDCDALRSVYPAAFSQPGDDDLSLQAAALGATIRSGAATQADQVNPDSWEWASGIYVTSEGGFGFTEPSKLPRPSHQRPWRFGIPRGSKLVGVAHSHDITMDVWMQEYGNRNYVYDPARLEEFSSGDMNRTIQRRIWITLHAPSGDLRIFSEGRHRIPQSVIAIGDRSPETHRGSSLPGAPSRAITNRIIACVREGYGN